MISAVVGDELSDDGHLLVGVDGLAGAEKFEISQAEIAEVAAVFVADTVITL